MVLSTVIEDKLAIQELMAQYSFSLDFGDIEAFVGCFTEDAVFEMPFKTLKGSSGLRQFVSERAAERREHPIRHMVMNFIVDVQGDRATAKAYFLFLRVFPELPESIQLLTTGVYIDELKKKGGTWRFSHRKVVADSITWASRVYPASYLEKNESEQKITKSK
jgi:ketosteroid isomerase-like protein